MLWMYIFRMSELLNNDNLFKSEIVKFSEEQIYYTDIVRCQDKTGKNNCQIVALKMTFTLP